MGSSYGPGLHAKVPFINQIRRFERRIVTQNYQGETFLTAENKGLIADFYIKWRIKDVADHHLGVNLERRAERDRRQGRRAQRAGTAAGGVGSRPAVASIPADARTEESV